MVLLNKFDGQTWTAVPAELTRKTYHLTSLPPFVVLLVNRFLKNRFFVEKNPTIVTFPVKSLDLAPYVEGSTGPLKYDLVRGAVVTVVALTEHRCRAFGITERTRRASTSWPCTPRRTRAGTR